MIISDAKFAAATITLNNQPHKFAKGLSDADLITFITKGHDASDPLNTAC